MAVGKGSMARASKAVKKVAEPVVEVAEVVETAPVEVAKEAPKKKAPAKKATKKTAEKKVAKAKPEEKEVKSANEIIAVGDEMPVYYF